MTLGQRSPEKTNTKISEQVTQQATVMSQSVGSTDTLCVRTRNIALAKKGPTGSFSTCTEVQLKSSIQHGHQNSRLKLIRTTHPDPLSRV